MRVVKMYAWEQTIQEKLNESTISLLSDMKEKILQTPPLKTQVKVKV